MNFPCSVCTLLVPLCAWCRSLCFCMDIASSVGLAQVWDHRFAVDGVPVQLRRPSVNNVGQPGTVSAADWLSRADTPRGRFAPASPAPQALNVRAGNAR
jgi:hypothetical protein